MNQLLQSTTRTLAVMACFTTAKSAALAQFGAPPSVVVAPVVEQTVSPMQSFVGTVQPLRRVTIGSAVDGRVVRFAVDEGDRVEPRQALAQLLTETITLELTTAQAELELRRQQLAELSNGSRPEEIAQALARMTAAEARREFAIARRDRAKVVSGARGVITDDEYEEAVALAAEAEQSFLEAEAVHALAVAGPRVELIAQAQAQVDMQAAIVQRLEDQIAKHTIISRFAGYVVAEHTDEGAWVNRGDPVAEVVAIDEVEVIAQVVENEVAFIKPGQEVEVEVPSLAGRRFRGNVTVTVPLADSRSRTFPVKVRVQNEITSSGPTLMPGMLARVQLPTGSATAAMLVPKDAVVLGGRSPMVFVVDGANSESGAAKVRSAPVTLGLANGSLVQVTGPLQPGELVVVEGNERLRPDQEVRVASQRRDDASASAANQ